MLFGHHTVDELIDIIAAKDSDVAMLAQLRAQHPEVASADPAWDRDHAMLQARYDAARRTAEAQITAAKYNITTPNSLIPAEDAYQGILRAVSPVPNTVTPGSLADLSGRLTRLGVKAPLGYQTPQPQADDLRDVNRLIQGGKNVLKAGVGGAADFRKDIVKGVGDAVPTITGLSWTTMLLLGAAGLLGLGYLVYKAAPAAIRIAEAASPGGRAVQIARAAMGGVGGESAFQSRVKELHPEPAG